MAVLMWLAYLTVAKTFAALHLLPMTDREKDTKILVLRHQITVSGRQLAGTRVRLPAPDRALLAALLNRLPRARGVLRRTRLVVRPDTVLRWHRTLIAGRRRPIETQAAG
ncbi:hypothetical protein ACQPZ8_32235 [Actinomadura nitritigenes]|uniref:hypothetical protein n=1 Tax=Actinomadura nitritigenes TaxID=134602 RepID=UPI003D93A800